MFIIILFTMAKTWKQPKCPSTDKWVKKMCFIYTMEYYSATKKNEIMSCNGWTQRLSCVLSHSVMSNSATPWTAAHQAPLSMGFSRQECQSVLPFPSSGDLPDPQIEPYLLHWQACSLPFNYQGSLCLGFRQAYVGIFHTVDYFLNFFEYDIDMLAYIFVTLGLEL